MATYGFNFRATSGYVADPANTTYSIGDTYPQTRNGITFGWTGSPASPSTRDRNSTVNARVAGINFTPSTTPLTFKIDLPAPGQYSVGCAMGDATFAQSAQYIEIFDGSTSLYSMTSSGGPGVNQYYDINGTLHTSDSNWASNQTLKNLTFSTTTLKVVIGKSGVGSNHTLAHFSITEAAGTSELTVTASDSLNSWSDDKLLNLSYLLGTGDSANSFSESVSASFKDYFLGVTDDADNLADAVTILLAVVLTLTVADDMDNLSDAITIEVEVFGISGIVMILIGVNIGVS